MWTHQAPFGRKAQPTGQHRTSCQMFQDQDPAQAKPDRTASQPQDLADPARSRSRRSPLQPQASQAKPSSSSSMRHRRAQPS